MWIFLHSLSERHITNVSNYSMLLLKKKTDHPVLQIKMISRRVFSVPPFCLDHFGERSLGASTVWCSQSNWSPPELSFLHFIALLIGCAAVQIPERGSRPPPALVNQTSYCFWLRYHLPEDYSNYRNRDPVGGTVHFPASSRECLTGVLCGFGNVGC